jgi:hypothetical protein
MRGRGHALWTATLALIAVGVSVAADVHPARAGCNIIPGTSMSYGLGISSH